MSTEKKSCNEDVRNEIPEFTQDEVQTAIDSLKKGKASDERNDQTDLQRSVEARGLNMEKNTYKNDLQ